MDEDDQRDLYVFWAKLDGRLLDLYEREAWKILPSMDKLVRERLGWPGKSPEEMLDRFNIFMEFIQKVYLRPSLNIRTPTPDDSSGNDSDDYGWVDAAFAQRTDFAEDHDEPDGQ